MADEAWCYSIGFTLPTWGDELYRKIPEELWAPAYDADRNARDGADVVEFTGIMDLGKWPKGMRVIVRRERPHPGASLRFEDVDGYRLTALATNTNKGQLPDPELRHRRRAGARTGSGTEKTSASATSHSRVSGRTGSGARSSPSHPNSPPGWDSSPTPTHEARRWEPKRLRYRLYAIAAVIAHTGRKVILHLSDRARWIDIAITAITTLRALPTATTAPRPLTTAPG